MPSTSPRRQREVPTAAAEPATSRIASPGVRASAEQVLHAAADHQRTISSRVVPRWPPSRVPAVAQHDEAVGTSFTSSMKCEM
jgi:hypothetical protein